MKVSVNENGFLICPRCGRKTNMKVLPDSILYHVPLWCNRCRVATVINYKPTSQS